MKKVLKLYRLTSSGFGSGYDEYDSAIVAAKSPVSAKKIHPNGKTVCSENSGDWATQTDLVNAEYIGTAKPGTKEGVVLASFNAG